MKGICKRLIAIVLTLLMFCSVLYIDTPTVKCINSNGLIASLVNYICQNVPGYQDRTPETKQKIRQQIEIMLNTSEGNKVLELVKSVGSGKTNISQASEVLINNCVSKVKSDSKENDMFSKALSATGISVDTLGNIMKISIESMKNGDFDAFISNGGSSADNLAESQEKTNVMSQAMSILDSYVYKGQLGVADGLGQNTSNTRLYAATWLVCKEIEALKIKGYSDLAIIGAMCNAFAESGLDPYMIQGNGGDKFNEFIKSNTSLSLKIDGNKDPWSIVNTSQSDVNSLLTDGQRVNHRVNVAPTGGIGLFQFTDCSNSKPSYGQFVKGYRRSYAIYKFSETTTMDPWTCVLECGTYDYWVPPANVDSNNTETIYGEDGSQSVITDNNNMSDKLCEKSTANNKISIASAEYQIGFFTEDDGPNCWLITGNGKSYMESKGLGDLTELTFNDFKNYQGTGNFSEDCRKAVTLFLLGVERPATTQGNYDSVDRTVNARCNQDLITAICEIGGLNGKEGLNLSVISDAPDYNASVLSKDDVLNGTGVYSHLRALAQSGYYTADELSQSCSGFEANVESELLALADRSYMTNKELYNLVAWENQVETTSFENTLVLMGRKLTLWIGILILVWSVLFYLAYWFDRVNTMFYIDLLGILSLKRLQATDAAENSTYNLSKEELGNKNVRIVAHRDVIKISIIGITLGTMFVTGTIFKILHSLMMWLYNFLT